jgi:acyl-CoA synthetase (AMP-forming)/AMP-acid ligase II
MIERPEYLNLHENLRHHVLTRPDKTAVIYEDERYTFRDLYVRAKAIAHQLQARGIGKGDHVGIYLRNHGAYIPIYYGLSMAGIVAVPLNYMITAGQAESLLELTQCRFLFTEAEQAPQVAEFDPKGMGAVESCDVDHDLPQWFAAEPALEEPDISVRMEDPMMILFSSGTTGLPKGILLSHLNRVLYFFSLGMEYGIRYQDINLCSTPLYHNAAIFFALNNLYFGATTVIHRKFNLEQTFEDIQKYQVTNTFLVPTQLHELIHSDKGKTFDLSSLKVIVSGAAPLATKTKESILECFPGVELHELYGLTETGLITNLRPQDQLRKVRCAGQAFLNMEFKVVDERGDAVPVGEVGEIITRGPTLFDGYYGNPEATQEAWRAGYFHTGDLGRMDEEGFLYIVDRLKDMILSGGVNIYPKDIEDVIYRLSAVKDVAVIGIPNEKWGEAVHAIVVLREKATLTEDEVLSTCRDALAAFQVPKRVEFRDELPRNPSGKLLKRVLREAYWQEAEAKV